MLNDIQIKQFQKIYKQYFGRDITKEEAYEQGTKIINIIRLVHTPMTQAEFDELQKRRISEANLFKGTKNNDK